MPSSVPFEKLQPCLLDRLTDEEPRNQQEGRNQRVISMQRYRQGVLRDLAWLFNASAHLPDEGEAPFRLSDFPLVWRSVLNFGTRQLCGQVAPNMPEFERQLTEALQTFEPRINKHSLKVRATLERNMVTLEVEGELWANPLPEQLFVKTRIDLESGQCVLGDSA